jgi:AraC-like DNA-binding protein
MVVIPRALLPYDNIERLIAMPLPGHAGIGALLTEFLVRLTADAGHYRPSDGPRLGTVLLDLVTAFLAHRLDADAALPPERRQRVLMLRIQAFIYRHLADPELSPSAIAAAHNISTRMLHRLFQTQGSTVSGWIRARRLDRCRRDLVDPMHGHRPIHVIAARWGFTDAAHFSRAFRAAYGLSPREYRGLHRRAASGSP